MRTTSTYTRKTMTVSVDTNQALVDWLGAQVAAYNLRWLLAFQEEGVIWGDVRESGLALSCDAHSSRNLKLTWRTLQQLRLFSSESELFVWRTAQTFQARLWLDTPGTQHEVIDEQQFIGSSWRNLQKYF